MTSPFEEINFLTRSENRVRLLETLTGGAYSESELIERTGISKVTVRRALDAFRERGWVTESDGGYTATRVGEALAVDYGRLEGTMDVACRLGPVVDLLPVEGMGFDLRSLSEVTISDPETYDVLQTVDRWVTLIREADRLEVFTYRSGRMVAEPVYEEIADGSLEMDAILAPSELERVRADPATREIKREILEAGANYYVAAEEPAKPYSFGMFGDIAVMTGWNGDSKPQTHIEGRADPLVEWVRGEYEAMKAEAEPLTVDDLSPER
jgi:biotin operon repressor